MKLFDNLSLREKDLWGELLIDVLVAVHYFPRAFALMKAGQSSTQGPELAGLVVSTVVLAIVASIVVFGFLHYSGREEPADERDRRFDSNGDRAGYWFLNGFLVLILMLLAASEFSSRQLPGTFLLTFGPLGVGHLILLSMVLASFASTTTRLYLYRRSA